MSWFDKVVAKGPIQATNLVCGTGSQFQPKNRWPELVGNHYLEAEQIIRREAPWTHVVSRPLRESLWDHSCACGGQKIVIFYDENKRVVRIPEAFASVNC